ncbi:MAG: type IV secretion system DNA-binding domain-containing protein, partial [Acidobacteria bacterium]|nr:type IV secretion system DNA-binding domain-containing protein [Acidobacteriota bacterium]
EVFQSVAHDLGRSICIFLRTGEPRAAEWVSRYIGEAEMEHVREGRSTGDWGMRSSRNATLDRKVEAAILASEIANLEDLTGYFQTPGYTLKLKFPFFQPETFQPALVRCDPPELYPLAESKEQKCEAQSNTSAAEPEPTPPDEAETEMKPVDNRKQLRGSSESGDTYPATGAA